MGKYTIEGPKKLNGEVQISGAKNSALKLMAASALTSEEVVIKNIPQIADVFTMAEVLEAIGVKTKFEGNSVTIDPETISSNEAPFDLVNKMRASILILGPLLARTGCAKIALPGGCKIGLRKIDYHIRGLELLGAEFKLDKGFIEANCGRLIGNRVNFFFPSVGATENLIMASVLAKGTTVVENAAREPEITDLADFLNSMGAKIHNAGTSTIVIEGVERLHGTEYEVMPDRIEAGTFAFSAAITGGEVTLNKINSDHLKLVIEVISKIGVKVEANRRQIKVKSNGQTEAKNIVTLPYPGFPTDLQAPAMALMAVAKGTSIITENVFENRFTTAEELKGMGADINIIDHHAVIKGVKELKGSDVKVPDLRGGAALVLAACRAKGNSQIKDIFHIERGYENFVDKMNRLGAEIKVDNGSKALGISH